MHRRLEPHPYGFRSSMFMFHLDLDEVDELVRRNPFVSRNRFNLYSFRDGDHLSLGAADVKENLVRFLRHEGVEDPVGRVTLLTNLRVLGHVFNPVSFFFVHDREGEPLAIVAEVHNTYGELKPFLLTRGDLEADWFRARRPKHFYISPFSGLDHELELRLRFPSERLQLFVSNRRPEGGHFFHAALTGRQVPLSAPRLLGFSLRFPLVTLKVVTLIHWHAFRLWRLGNPVHAKTSRPDLQRGILPKTSSSSAS